MSNLYMSVITTKSSQYSYARPNRSLYRNPSKLVQRFSRESVIGGQTDRDTFPFLILVWKYTINLKSKTDSYSMATVRIENQKNLEVQNLYL